MTTPLLLALLILVLLAAWPAWQYFSLRIRLREFIKALRRSTPEDIPSAAGGLEELSTAVSALAADLSRHIGEVSRERDRLAAVLDQITDGVLIADAEGVVQFANPAARELFESADAPGRTVTQVVRHHQLVEVWRRSREMNALQSGSVEMPARRQFLHLIALPDQHAGGSLLLVQDLTQVRRLETVRRDFLSNISHELRTPLASLKALTETLQDGALQDPAAGALFLERIGVEVDALTQMTQEMLDLSRTESGQDKLELADVSPASLLEAAAQRMQAQAARGGLQLRVDAAETLPAVRADAARLEQVLVNLIHNAVKFSHPGGEIMLAAEASQAAGPRMVVFSVQDNGAGIPADDLPRIFERFYRVDKARAGGGTGLGLSIARHIVEAHGGAIRAESTEGRGSTFFFTIPTSDQTTK